MTQEHDQVLESAAQRHGVSKGAVEQLWAALERGGGVQAQFDVAELGGRGQWMRGGMTMVGTMFDNRLKAKVDALCTELSAALPARSTPASQPSWWPGEWGNPSIRGGQNDTEYAWFPQARRLAVREGRSTRFYDTLDHRIGGVSQQGGPVGTVHFQSQHGALTVDSLPQVDKDSEGGPPAAATSPAAPTPSATSPESVIASLSALADLHARGVLTDEEFSAKKADLLARL